MNSFPTISEVSVLLKSKKLSPIDVTKTCLERIEKLNPKLNAFITINPDALKQASIAAEEIQDGHYRGPLHGIPIGLKDFYDTAGMRTTAAFEHFKDRIPSKDAVVVKLLKEAGAIIIGKTNMHELGSGTTSHISYFGPVHNPWNENYVAGGSSGGSAAAVATGLCFGTIDTDAVGSCRLPASCCGVVGFKGTYGLISSNGILEGEKTDDVILKLAHPGLTTRSVADSAILLDAVGENSAGKMQRHYSDNLEKIDNIRVAVVKNFKASKEIKDIFLTAIEKLGSHMRFTEIEVPFQAASFDIKNIDSDRKNISGQLFKDVDVLALPTVTSDTPTLKDAEKFGPLAVATDNTFFCNYFALPAITIPCGLSSTGLPVGLQLVGRSWDEKTILSVAFDVEKSLKFEVRAAGKV